MKRMIKERVKDLSEKEFLGQNVGSLLCSKRFTPGTTSPVIPSPQKPTFDLI